MFKLIAKPLPTTKIITELEEINNALTTLDKGLTLEIINNTAMAAYSQRQEITDSYATNAQGIIFYEHMVGILRNGLQENNWTKRDNRNCPFIITPDGDNAIAFLTGTKETGIEDATPSNKNNRLGQNISDGINQNNNMILNLEGGTKLWILLFFVKNEIIHMELSLPTAFESNRITQWETRIILPSLNPYGLEPVSTNELNVPSTDVEVLVTRKKRNG